MIDLNLVNKAYNEDGFYSLQLEVGDRCFQGCRSRSYAAGLGMYGKDPRCFRKGPSA